MRRTHRSAHLANIFGAALSVWGDALGQALEGIAGAGGATPSALVALDSWPDRSIDFLAGVLGLTHSGTVRLVHRLESEGLVHRGAGIDRRTTALRLTEEGGEAAADLRAERYRVISDVLEQLDDAEQAVLESALDRILRAQPRTRTEARHACRMCDHSVCVGLDCPVGMSVAQG